MAWLPGSVQGVVVQITANAFSGACARPKARATAAGSAAAKATSMAAEVLSSYSTSASARAEPHSMHQLTGFRPRYRSPFFQMRASARISSASVAKSIVL